MTLQRTCTECDQTYTAKRATSEFCATPCRQAYNNRRMQRGAELYDLVMTMRFDRAHAKDEQIWGQLCAVASAYRDADKALRGGRKSYDPNFHKTLPLTYGSQGDKR